MSGMLKLSLLVCISWAAFAVPAHGFEAGYDLTLNCSSLEPCKEGNADYCLRDPVPFEEFNHSCLPVQRQGDCSVVKGRFEDASVGKPYWLPWRTLVDTISELDPAKHPAVLVRVSSIPCATGCCEVDLFVRPGETDPGIMDALYYWKEDEFWYDLAWTPHAIMDAGANVGLATILLAQLFPEALIVAVEPDPVNFAMLTANTYRYANVIRVNKGLWHRDTGLKLVRQNCTGYDRRVCGSWGTRVEEAADNPDLQAVSVETLLQDYNVTGFDIIKMDIEGTEKPLFEHKHDWMQHVRLLSIEIHRNMEEDVRQGIRDSIQIRGGGPDTFKHSYAGEYDVFTRQHGLPQEGRRKRARPARQHARASPA